MTLIDGFYTDLEKPLLYIHIFAGFVSLGTAYLLLFLKKGDKRHKKYGMYYVYGMSTIFVTAIPLSMMGCLLYTSPSPRDLSTSRMPSSA